MNRGALILLKDPVARRLLVAWPTIESNGPDDQERAIDIWLRGANVPLERGQAIARLMLRSGICLPDGKCAHEAESYLQAIVAGDLNQLKSHMNSA